MFFEGTNTLAETLVIMAGGWIVGDDGESVVGGDHESVMLVKECDFDPDGAVVKKTREFEKRAQAWYDELKDSELGKVQLSEVFDRNDLYDDEDDERDPEDVCFPFMETSDSYEDEHLYSEINIPDIEEGFKWFETLLERARKL